MDFLGVGGPEILLILVVALIIFGPARLVGIGRTLGRTVRALRKVTSDLTAQVTKEMQDEDGQEEKRGDKTDKSAKS